MSGITHRHVIPTEMKWSGGIYSSGKLYLTQVIFATWVDSSTPLRSGRNDRRFRFGYHRFKCTTIPAPGAGWRQIAAATAVTYNGTPHVAAMIHRHVNVTKTPRADERHHLPTCHPDRNEMEWRDPPKLQALPYVGYSRYLGRFLHSADATVGMTDVSGLAVTKFKCTTIPAPGAGWRQIAAATAVFLM